MVRQIVCGCLIAMLGIGQMAYADFFVDRRRDQYPPNFGYFVYPIPINIPGLGKAFGAGATFVNVANTDTDLTGFYIDGDFHAAGITALNTHLIPNRLLFDVGLYQFRVAFKQFERGIDSNENNFIYPEIEGYGGTGQLTLTFFDKRLDFYSRFGQQTNQVNSVYDSSGNNNYIALDNQKETGQTLTLGVTLDLTDDRQDPRSGFRFEANRKEKLNDTNPDFSTYTVYDANLTFYIPMDQKDTWVWNIFRSHSKVSQQGSTDFNYLQGRYGFNCGSYTDATAQADCNTSESRYINDIIKSNRYGNATFLGGTQRLRSYETARFRGGETLFIGTEYRWNLTEEYTPVDWFFLKGHRTNLQLSLFAGAGSVAERSADLTNKFKYSYGAGFRVLFEGVTLRADAAHGDEGMGYTLFIDYPFSMFSVDSPG